MQAADDARASRLQKLAPADGEEGGKGETQLDSRVPPLQRSEGGPSSISLPETTVSLMPHVGVQVIPPINFGMVEDGLYRWLAQIAVCTLAQTLLLTPSVPSCVLLVSVAAVERLQSSTSRSSSSCI
eukprot:COSAG02_NODE_1805_length_10872_cov_7.969461_5_plen_127_part_00